MAKLALSVLPASRIHLIDSKPLPVANPKSPYPQRGTPALGKRSSWSKFPEARKGFSTMGMVFGFKLHALTNIEGLFERWAFAAANHPDVTRSSTEAVFVHPWESNGVWSESLARARKWSESSFSTLVRSLTLQAAQAKTFLSLTRRVRL